MPFLAEQTFPFFPLPNIVPTPFVCVLIAIRTGEEKVSVRFDLGCAPRMYLHISEIIWSVVEQVPTTYEAGSPIQFVDLVRSDSQSG